MEKNSIRHCPRCNKEKTGGDFYWTGRQSYSAWCKDCHKAWSKAQKQSGYRAPYIPRPRRLLSDIQFASYEMWSNAQKRDIRSGRPFTLTRENVEELVSQFCENNYYEIVRAGKSPFQPSLDRIDPNLGYELSNIRVVWLIENYARNSFTDDDVIEFCKRKLGLI